MKFHHPIFTLLLLGIATSGLAVNTTLKAAEVAVNSAGERLDNPIPNPIQKGSIRLRLKQIATGLTGPNWAVFAPGDSEHLYTNDQTGKLWRIDLTSGDKFFMDFSSLLVPLGISGNDSFDERGFLGFAFHPQYGVNEILYTYTSESAEDTSDFSTIPTGASANHRSVIREWKFNFSNIDPDPAVQETRILLTIDQPQFNHNGGALNFGPDGMLYIALGDGGGADDRDSDFIGDPMIGHGANGNGQNPGNPLGSLLRIDPLGNNSDNGKYGIPVDNPFVGSDTILPETYAYGFRNPFRFSFDSLTSTLVLVDVGQNDIEEVNLVESGGNYGWGLKEGSFRFEPNGNDAGFVTDGIVVGNFIDPVIQYDHDEGIAIIGGFVYRGNAIPALQGKYVFGDTAKTGNSDGRIFYSDGSKILELDLTDRDQPDFWVLGFGQDGDGELYVLGNTTGTPFGSTGTVYKLIPNASFEGNLLEIPAVRVTLAGGENTIYRARLQHVPVSDPMRFELIDAEILASRFRDDSATFDPSTGGLNLSFINVANTSGQIFTYSVELQQVPGQPNLNIRTQTI